MKNEKELMEVLEKGTRQVYESDSYRSYLKAMAVFHSYSAANCMLILHQMPDATLVAGYQTWARRFGRHVSRGQRGIRILAPVLKKTKEEENSENHKKVLVSCRAVSVFDISQTEGKPLPSFMNEKLSGSVPEYDRFLECLKAACGMEVSFEKPDEDANGCWIPQENKILIRPGMSQLQSVKTLVHEMAHTVLHKNQNDLSREQKEVEAESTAFVVCAHYGLDTSSYSFPYVASWSSSADLKELRESQERIRQASNELIFRISRSWNPELAALQTTFRA